MAKERRRLVPMYEAAAELASLCKRIEDGEDLDQLLLTTFDRATASLSESIDRRRAFVRELKSKIDLAKDFKRQIQAQQKVCERILDRLKEQTLQLLKDEPDLPWKGSLGGKMSIGRAKESLRFDTSIEDALMGEVNIKYLSKIVKYEWNKEAILEDLEKGIDLPWVRLEKTEYVRGL
jgi:hypothetical protein